MKNTITMLAISAALTGASSAATLVNQTFTADQNWTDDNSIAEIDTTWIINSGVTITATTGRFFIETKEDDNNDSAFIIDGGGTLLSTHTGTYASFRLGHASPAGRGTLQIQGGSTVELSTLVTDFGADATGGTISLIGVGSTFVGPSTYNSVTEIYAGSGGWAGVSVTVSGGNLQVSTLGDGRTQLTVVPEPSSAALLGLGGLALILRRRK